MSFLLKLIKKVFLEAQSGSLFRNKSPIICSNDADFIFFPKEFIPSNEKLKQGKNICGINY